MRLKNEITEGTLAWCNEMRQKKGLPILLDLPLGVREDPASCPCGAATGLYVTYQDAFTSRQARNNNELPVCSLPEAVREFTRNFDQGLIPEYEEGEGE